MTEEIIKKIIEIDAESKNITRKNEDKNANIDKYIKQELAIKESVMEVIDKNKIEKLEEEYNTKLKEEENKLREKNIKEIQELKNKFEESKNEKIEELFQYAIKKVGE